MKIHSFINHMVDHTAKHLPGPFNLIHLFGVKACLFFIVGCAHSEIDFKDEQQSLHAKFSGVVLASRGGETVFAQSFGLADVVKNEKNTPEHVFRVGSISKTFTAVLVHMLAAEQQLSLDDSVDDHIKGIPRGDLITIRMLIEHRSGLRDWSQKEWKTLLLAAPGPTQQDVIDLIRAKKQGKKPGKKYQYNNLGYNLLGLIIEQVAGSSYEQVLQQKLLQPLALSDTGFAVYDHEVSGISQGYGPRKKIDTHTYNYAAIKAVGGLYSTVADMDQWCRALNQSDLIPVSYRASLPGWKQGQRFGRQAYWHPGNTNTYSALLVMFPEIDGCYVVLSNSGREKPLKTIMRALPKKVFERDN